MQRKISIVPYDNKWEQQFKIIKKSLMNIFGNNCVDIQHIGSTAILGMPAKPIIDVLVAVKDLKAVDELNDKMEEAGCRPKGESGIPGRRYFQKFAADGVNHTEHIHCFEHDNPIVKEHLMFRDFLMIDKDSFNEYLAVKNGCCQ